MEKTGFLCKKCKFVPLIQIVPKEKDIKIFTMCKCNKELIPYDIFMKNYYKVNLTYSEISNHPIYSEYVDPSPRFSNNEKEINLEKINKDFYYIIEKINEYNLEIKMKIIEILKNKIAEIENIYSTNNLNNKKLQNLIEVLINNYKSNKENSSNIKNLLYNKNFNMGYRNETYSTLNFKNEHMSIDSLFKNVSKYLKNNYILSSYNEQLCTINTFFNHKKEATCVVEVQPEIIASSSKDNYIILYNLEKKKCIYKYNAHDNGVNWLLKINENNILSCGGDGKIKIWPKVQQKNLELVNSEYNGTTNTEEIVIKPIGSYVVEEPILKIILVDENYICGFSSKNIYLIKFEILEGIDNKENINESFDIKLDIEGVKNFKVIYDIISVKNKKNENIIIVVSLLEVYFLSLKNLQILAEIKSSYNDKQSNCITQINKDEVLLSTRQKLSIIDINYYIIKLETFEQYTSTFLSKLRDNTILLGTKDGIKRINIKNFEEITFINKIYSAISTYPPSIYPTIPEKFNYVYEISDRRLIICSSYGNIKICKFKIA